MKAIGDIINAEGYLDFRPLKKNQCPKCNASLEEIRDSGHHIHKCTNKDCTFWCSDRKFNDIVNRLYRPTYQPHTEEENLKALNEL